MSGREGMKSPSEGSPAGVDECACGRWQLSLHQPSTTTPAMSAHQTYEIAADSDDDDIVATSGATLLPPTAQQKGKARESSPAQGPDPLAGRIGSSTGGIGERTTRSSVGGVQTETRYTGTDTLDEPVSETIVSHSASS